MPVIQSCRLVCTEGGHNKEYLVELHEERQNGHGAYVYRVDGRYGRIGSVLTGVRKYNGSSRYQADAEYNKVRNEKLSKRYREVPLVNQYAPIEDTAVANDTAPEARSPRRTRRAATPPVPDNTVDFFDNAPRLITL